MDRKNTAEDHKYVVYQVFTRLFGNTETTNKAWGSIEENGVGKFNDISDRALKEIKDLGVTHIWYTGVPHHAVIRDYTSYGISNDDPDVVKGRAGSPYAVKDYYTVNPDLAVDPGSRMEEFEALIQRTHDHGMRVIIDIVPNHVARNYKSISKPEGVEDFGASDNISLEYQRDNNFYYIPGESFQVPDFEKGFEPLGGEQHPLADGEYAETPSRWSGNGAKVSKPNQHDWYETVKINFGMTPDGKKDFAELPEEYAEKSIEEHFMFWQDKEVPDSWVKFRQIAHYWLEKGVDGFRYDMAQMVPVEFWSYLNSSIKMSKPEAFLLSEIYIPEIYRDYIHLGKMDYLYDKVQLYDTLKNIIQGKGSTDNIPGILKDLGDIEHHMLHFLENHDEHRIASPDFAGDARKAKPAMVLSATVGTSPTMLYFGQEVGEKGEGDPGYGKAGRTTIYDYWGVPAHQRWMNEGAFDGGMLIEEEKTLREFYRTLLNFTIKSEALMGNYGDIHAFNREVTEGYHDRLFSYLRWSANEKLLIVLNFGEIESMVELGIPESLRKELGLSKNSYNLDPFLGKETGYQLLEEEGLLKVDLSLAPLESFIFRID